MSTAKQNISKLPEYCYSTDNCSGKLIKIMAGMAGFYPQHQFAFINRKIDNGQTYEQIAEEFNAALGVTPIQKECMEIGSMFGWEVPGANPDTYKMVVVPK